MSLKKYTVQLKYSKDGKTGWTVTNVRVSAESDLSAIEQARSKYPHTKDIKIIRAEG